MIDLSRREYMGAVAAAAATRLDNEEYDIENADQWEPLSGGTYQIGQFTAQMLTASGQGAVGGWLVERGVLDDCLVEVFYSTDGITVALEGDAGDVRASTGAELAPDQAREIGAALYQAAEELEARRAADSGEEVT